MNAYSHVAVVGASSQVARLLIPRLIGEGIKVYRIGRNATEQGVDTVHIFDERNSCFIPPIQHVDAIISLAPLPTISIVLKMAECLGARRVIAFGSTGRFTKVGTTSTVEQEFIKQQEDAELCLANASSTKDIAWTLFRPTMIYGSELDLNVAFIRNVIRRFGIFPVPVGANGLRQPVHIGDLADACALALACKRTFNKAYNLGGGEVITFPDMVRRIFLSEQKVPILLPIPFCLYRWMVSFISKSTAYKFIRTEMIARMFKDLIVDNSNAMRDFNYKPRPFLPKVTKD